MSADWRQVSDSFWQSSNLDGGARGLHMGWSFNHLDDVVFVTIPTAGNAIDFGDLITARYLNSGYSSNSLR